MSNRMLKKQERDRNKKLRGKLQNPEVKNTQLADQLKAQFKDIRRFCNNV